MYMYMPVIFRNCVDSQHRNVQVCAHGKTVSVSSTCAFNAMRKDFIADKM